MWFRKPNIDDMKKTVTKYRLLFVCCTFICMTLASCMREDIPFNLTEEQKALIGRKVDFNASVSQQFATRASYADPNGEFNVGDQLTIFRQYWDGASNSFGQEEYRQYYLYQKVATGTDIYVGKPEWKPIVGRMGGKWDTDQKKTVQFPQTEADSLTWDDDRTVRFRAIGRSNYAGGISSGKRAYYPDFTISDWITVSGPTLEIPFTMKHLGSRMYFSPKTGGNLIQKIEICTAEADYAWIDNSDTPDNDDLDKFPVTSEDGTRLTAAQAAANVAAAYNRMCIPAGIDIETGLLKTMTSDFYTNGNDATFATILDNNSSMVAFGTLTPDQIASTIQRPVFSSRLWGNRLFFVTIPYDMSNASTQGEALILPPYTRFKIWMYDVNGDDRSENANESGKRYHIFSLSDAKANGVPAFPDGLEFGPGISYNFTVGYVYDQLVVEVGNEFSWDDVQLDAMSGQKDNTIPQVSQDQPYGWWQKAIDDAIAIVENSSSNADNNYNPKFVIKTKEQFLEFVNLVNGTAATNTFDLNQAYRRIYNTDGTVSSEGYWWYTEVNAKGDTLWTTRQAMEQEGFVFFKQFYQSVGDNRAESRESYLKGPFSFYDTSFDIHFSVELDADIDMDDWAIESIGKTEASAFKGNFDGKGHSISNLYVKGEHLFGNVEGADIRNLVLSSTEKMSLVNVAKGANHFVGISLKADCTGSSIANSIIGDVDGRPNPSYVVACIHEGMAGKGMVGKADNLFMYGCMETGKGISGGALLASYSDATNKFFAPQKGAYADWGRFMCNYYDKERSPGTSATADASDVYKPQEYIRGAKSHVLKAIYDYTIPDELPYKDLSAKQKEEMYGLAPWKALNYAIVQYNASTASGTVKVDHKCNMHFETSSVGYDNKYPSLKNGVPTDGTYANVLDQNN